ncbi:helix-turn-helix domain-containing protein [Kribbella sp. NPDC050124]|uniref:helix-turn-helix domain-containing protein n=1 Tax=Kribbella sp. NPDC050124 TaxID=3364114 RepID=UPI0037B677E3
MQESTEGKRDWLNVAEMAAVMGLSEMTLYRAIANGEFPAVRIGRRLFIPARLPDQLAEAAISTGRVVTAAEVAGEAS